MSDDIRERAEQLRSLMVDTAARQMRQFAAMTQALDDIYPIACREAAHYDSRGWWARVRAICEHVQEQQREAESIVFVMAELPEGAPPEIYTLAIFRRRNRELQKLGQRARVLHVIKPKKGSK